MNPEQLLQHFDRISEAPDAIPSLRRFILNLAVRGKLVEQDPNDEPADRIFEGYGNLAKKPMRTRRDAKDEEHTSSEYKVSPILPHGWLWIPFQKLLIQANVGIDRGRNLQGIDKGYIYFKMNNIRNNGGQDIANLTRIDATQDEVKEFKLADGDFLFNTRNSRELVGKTCVFKSWNSEPVLYNNNILRVKLLNQVSPDFLDIWFQSPKGKAELEKLKSNTTNVCAIYQGKLSSFQCPIPPLAEQHRIVAKVDELMALCDQLQAAQIEREQSRDRLVAASLHSLNPSTDDEAANAPETQREHARFIFNHLPRLTTRPAHIKQLRQTILNLAVRGKLVPQDTTDEPAGDLLMRIGEERAKLVKSGVIRKEKPLSGITNDDLPFSIPDSWKWAKIGYSALFTEYGTSQQSFQMEDGVPVLKMGDIQDGKVLLGGQKKVSNSIDDLPALYLEKFDLLYNRTNSAELVGKTGIYLGDDNQYTFASYLIRIRLSKVAMNAMYFNLAMNSPYFRTTQILPHLKQQCGQANVNGTILKNMLVPIPPLTEQHRIVAKVDELMALCDQLETQLADTAADSRRLLEAVLHQALLPTEQAA